MESRSPRRLASACAKQRMPLPLISARPPSALNRIILAAYPSADSPTIKPSAPMPRRRSHTCRASAARSETAGWNVTRKSLPSPWCLVNVSLVVVGVTVVVDQSSCECVEYGRQRLGHRIRFDVDPAYARVAAEPPFLSNGELASPRDDRRDRRIERAAPLQVLDELLVAERLAGGPRDRPLQQRRRPRRRARRRSSSGRARSIRRANTSRGQRRPSCATGLGGYTSSPGPNELNARPLPTHTSSARTTRRVFVGSIRAAATGSSAASRAWRAGVPRRSAS